jgi:hypothetical protein
LALEIKQTGALISPEALRLKVLIYGMHGSGKTTWTGTTPNPGIGVCETGWGKGLLSIAANNLSYTELNSYEDFTQFCSGTVFKDKDTLVLDSLSEMFRTFIKDKALSIPRARGESAKRAAGVLELDDYGVIAELARKLIKRLLDQPKHIVVTSGLRIDKPDMESGQGETLVGPDLSGQMFLGSTAMFDIVLCLRTRTILRDPKDAKSREVERYFVTQSDGASGIIAKNRLSVTGLGSFLPREVIFNPKEDMGTFSWFLNQAKEAYGKYIVEHPAEVK